MGPDLRWAGNELGYVKPDCFASTTPALHPEADPAGQPAPGYCSGAELGCGSVDGGYYLPPECDVPLRPGWFYHAREDKYLRSVQELIRIYVASVGSGGYLNLGIAPDRRGLLHDNDVARLKEFGAARKRLFENKVFQESVTLTSGSVCQGSFNGVKTVNLIELREDLANGERVTEYTLTLFAGDQPVHCEKGTAVGRRRIRAFAGVKADRWELRAVSRDGEELKMQVAVFLAPEEYFRGDFDAAALTDRKDYRKLDKPLRDKCTLTWELATEQNIAGAIYVPHEFLHGRPELYRYEIRLADGTWQEAARGEFSNIRANPIPQVTEWDAVCGTAIRFTAERVVGEQYRVQCREFGILVK